MRHLSDSKVQLDAERMILNGVEKHLGVSEGTLQTVRLPLSNKVSIEIDGYNEEHRIMVEVFAGIGKLAPAYYEKLADDILKLKMAEDKLGIEHQKYIAVCGEEAERYLLGSSWKAFAVNTMDSK